jgi:phage terminase large subunit-like protein
MSRKKASLTVFDIADGYARDVLAGEIPAGEYLRLACQRHVADVDAGVWAFDHEQAERVVTFVEKMPHTKGRWAARGELIKLEAWQVFIVASLFGWVSPDDGLRRFREAYIEVARKNAKSTLAAALAVYMFCADGEYSSEVYSLAQSEKQAWEVFRPARLMCRNKPALCDHFGIEVNASNLVRLEDYSRFEPMIGNPGDGASPYFVVVDEFHEAKSAAAYETIQTGTGSRSVESAPLIMAITTAGDDIAGPCYEKRQEIIKVLNKTFDDDRQFGLIYSIDDGDDWTDPQVWRKSNPNIGVSVSEEYIADQVYRSLRTPSKQSALKKKHFNLWSGARFAFVNMEQWVAAADPSLSVADLDGAGFVTGLDLATRVDLAARVDLGYREIDGVLHYYCFPTFYLPESALQGAKNSATYEGWHAGGHIDIMDGDEITFAQVEQDIRALPDTIDLRELAYDPWQSTQMAQSLDADGFPVVEIRQTTANLSPAMREFEGALAAGRFHHNGNPVLTWNASNLTAREDANSNVHPRKDLPENKIDGMVALFMAMSRAMSGEPEATLAGFLDSIA